MLCGGHFNKAPPQTAYTAIQSVFSYAGGSLECFMAFIFYLLSSSLGNCECALVRGVSGVSDRAILPHQASSQYPKGTMEPLRPLFFPKMEACNPITLS